MDREQCLQWLKEERPDRLDDLFAQADAVRDANVGDAVHLRGLLEFSNHCVRHCAYCGLCAPNRNVRRYRMDDADILAAVDEAVFLGYRTVVLQSGEDPKNKPQRIAALVERIKARHANLALTLSLGEADRETYALWRQAGADRYLLRFETSDIGLFRSMHRASEGGEHPRIKRLKWLKDLGYEVGGGVMVGLPGQTLESLADDLMCFAKLELDMVGVGPYIPHPDTTLGSYALSAHRRPPDHVEPSFEMALKMLALVRLVLPKANLPATTALQTVGRGWREGLRVGANVLMPKLTPPKTAAHYRIYPGDNGQNLSAEQRRKSAERLVQSLGRRVGMSLGVSKAFAERQTDAGAA